MYRTMYFKDTGISRVFQFSQVYVLAALFLSGRLLYRSILLSFYPFPVPLASFFSLLPP